MPRIYSMHNARHLDTPVAFEGPRRPPRRSFVDAAGAAVANGRLVKATEGTDAAALLRLHPDPEALAQALITGDPELDRERVGRRLPEMSQVWLGPSGKILYTARMLKVTADPQGQELSREDFVEVEATVHEKAPIPWTGRFLPIDRVVRSFVLVQKLQIRHINGVTFEFLHEIAKVLQQKQQLLLVGTGDRASPRPLIFSRNGSPYRGFLEGRADDTGFLLVLHLSNFELKKPAAAAAPGAEGTP